MVAITRFGCCFSSISTYVLFSLLTDIDTYLLYCCMWMLNKCDSLVAETHYCYFTTVFSFTTYHFFFSKRGHPYFVPLDFRKVDYRFNTAGKANRKIRKKFLPVFSIFLLHFLLLLLAVETRTCVVGWCCTDVYSAYFCVYSMFVCRVCLSACRACLAVD